MNKFTLILAAVFSINCSASFAKSHQSIHFIVESDLNTSYLDVIHSNIETYYSKITTEYFPVGWEEPLKIIYSETQSDTRKLLADIGYNTDIRYGVYIPSLNTIYTHRRMDSGNYSGLGTVFHEIIHHFVHLNFPDSPSWFNEGLATVLGEQVRCVNNRLTLGNPNPWREKILKNMIEKGFEIDVKNITSLGNSEFYENSNNYHPTRALFLWIYHQGCLPEYIKNVQQDGYSLKVLQETVKKSHEQINAELLEFIKTHCYPAAFYQDGILATTLPEKKKFFNKSLSTKPGYTPAILELAICFYREKNIDKCLPLLTSILENPHCIEYYRACEILGHINYSQKNYSNAVKFYETAWNCGRFDIHRYKLAYSIGCCYHFLRNHARAGQWLKEYIERNFQPEHDPEKMKFAVRYQAFEQNNQKQ